MADNKHSYLNENGYILIAIIWTNDDPIHCLHPSMP